MRSMKYGLLPAALAAVPVVAAQTGSADPCARVAQQQVASAQVTTQTLDGDLQFAAFDAQDAFDCATSVPIAVNEATTMVQVIKQYISFHTNIAYLKDPPASYQQDGIDIMARLDDVADKAATEGYRNQYEFDIDVNWIINAAKEGHLNFSAGVLGLFQWFLSENLVSVSKDGSSIPEVYAYSDVVNSKTDISPVIEIEGESVFTYMRSYINATSRTGRIEPHAEWNSMMFNPAIQFSGFASGTFESYSPSFFEATPVYNGASLKGKFANGTDFEWPYSAGSTRNLLDSNYTSGTEIYARMVRNVRLPVSGTTQTRSVEEEEEVVRKKRQLEQGLPEPLTAVPFPSYPQNPIVVQDRFGRGGSVSGYLLTDISVGVLSIPSFSTNGDSASAESFSAAVESFIQQAKQANIKKVVLDMSGNGGGTILQGFDTFKHFFPDLEPGLTFRTRATTGGNVFGSIITAVTEDDGNFVSEDYRQSFANKYGYFMPVNSAYTTKPNGESWDSWAEFFGPRKIHGDTFTNSAKYNLTSWVNTNSLVEPIFGYGNGTVDGYEQPWAAEDIILLSDGSCASTCSLFAELLKTDAGVKSVVVGGIPSDGPMQSVSGTRGSNIMPWGLVSGMIQDLRDLSLTMGASDTTALLTSLKIDQEQVNSLPPSLNLLPWNVRSGGVNVLDEIRVSSPDDPLQFAYQAADCRLFYTGAMVRDVTQLWRAAARVLDGNMTACVNGSTDGPGVSSNETIFSNPGFSGEDQWANANTTSRLEDDSDTGSSDDEPSSSPDKPSDKPNDDSSGDSSNETPNNTPDDSSNQPSGTSNNSNGSGASNLQASFALGFLALALALCQV